MAETQMEVGGTAVAKAAFKDATGKAVKPKSVEWSTTNAAAVVVSADDKDVSQAKLVALGQGPAQIVAVGVGEEGGSATATTSVLVIAKDQAATGEVTIGEVKGGPAKPKAEAPAQPQSSAHPAAHPAPAHT